jgi:arylsulfatase A-like enzyme
MKIARITMTAVVILSVIASCLSGQSQPNILFIMSDDHAEQAISCYSDKLIQTPNIDRIAAEGVLFENSFVTNSICSPSRAVLLTGKYSHKNGLRDNLDIFDNTQLTFPKLLQKAGYKTAIIGKWHLHTTPTGFDTWKVLQGQGEYYNPLLIENGKEKEYVGYTTDIITNKAIEFMDRQRDGQPFCLLVHHKAPHRNWMPDTKHLQGQQDKQYPLPETFYDDYTGRMAAKEADMRIDEMFLSFDLKLEDNAYPMETGTGGNTKFSQSAPAYWQKTYDRMTEEQKQAWNTYYEIISENFKEQELQGKELLVWKYQRYMNDYLRCVQSVDENIGRLLDYLDENDLTDNTLVIYTSDQGFYLGEHGWYDKRFMYEESLSMPLVMRFPGKIKAGHVSEKMVLNLDFAPTILDFAGISKPEEMQGKSMRPLFINMHDGQWRDGIYYHYYQYEDDNPDSWHQVNKHYGIRTDRYKLIHFYHILNKWELYDLEKDPNEINNVFDNPAYQKIIDTLKIKLKKLQDQYEDTDFLLKD